MRGVHLVLLGAAHSLFARKYAVLEGDNEITWGRACSHAQIDADLLSAHRSRSAAHTRRHSAGGDCARGMAKVHPARAAGVLLLAAPARAADVRDHVPRAEGDRARGGRPLRPRSLSRSNFALGRPRETDGPHVRLPLAHLRHPRRVPELRLFLYRARRGPGPGRDGDRGPGCGPRAAPARLHLRHGAWRRRCLSDLLFAVLTVELFSRFDYSARRLDTRAVQRHRTVSLSAADGRCAGVGLSV